MQPHDIATLPTLVFGEPGDFREWIVNEILSGRKTATTNLEVAFHLNRAAIPLVGEERALIDSTDRRVAVLRYVEVARTSIAMIDQRLALHEATSIEHWRDIHRDYWLSLVPAIRDHLGDPDWQLDETEPAICTVFEIVEIVAP
ncbi:MAG: RNA-binding protein [Rhodoglobus sp.]|nr:RNA-binding protein [Rhodoglobus sp.]